MSSLVKQEDIVVGMVIYKIHAFPDRGFDKSDLDEYKVIELPKISEVIPPHICMLVQDLDFPNREPETIFLNDAGIIENDYNFHQTFSDRDEAIAYARRMDNRDLTPEELVKQQKITGKIRTEKRY